MNVSDPVFQMVLSSVCVLCAIFYVKDLLGFYVFLDLRKLPALFWNVGVLIAS